MHNPAFLSSLALALALTASISAQSLDHDDIAPQCASVCTNIANVSDECERQNEDVPNEDRRELDCICNAPGMDTLIPACEACQRQYYGRGDDYEKIRTLLRRCGFAEVTGTMTQAPAAESTVFTTTYTSTEIDDGDGDEVDVETDTITSYRITDAGPTTTAGGAVGAGASVTDAAGSAAGAAGSAVDQSGNSAPVMTAAPVLAVAGVAAAVFGL